MEHGEMEEDRRADRSKKRQWRLLVGGEPMLGRGIKHTVVTWKDQNGRELENGEEVVQAFYRRKKKTFKISEEENQDFCPITEGEVKEWKRV